MSAKKDKIDNFDPNNISTISDNLFGLPFTTEESKIVIVPVPWEVTTSYGGGTANGPHAVLTASHQVDLYDPNVKDAWKIGMSMDEINESIQTKNEILREKATSYIKALEDGESAKSNPKLMQSLAEINAGSKELNSWVKDRVLHFMNKGKVVGLLGGDHSTPLGMMEAVAEKFGDFSVLHIDAHADLRDAYEGFEFSHASIMFNALKIKNLKKLVQVGIRDFCEAELAVINRSNGRVIAFFDRDIKHAQYKGESWDKICSKIVEELPQNIYLSFDIDGLDPKLCPDTGTPVAGGFETEQVLYLIEKIVATGKKIVAFDINEISVGANNNEWNANVGARLLYRVANLVGKSWGLSGADES